MLAKSSHFFNNTPSNQITDDGYVEGIVSGLISKVNKNGEEVVKVLFTGVLLKVVKVPAEHLVKVKVEIVQKQQVISKTWKCNNCRLANIEGTSTCALCNSIKGSKDNVNNKRHYMKRISNAIATGNLSAIADISFMKENGEVDKDVDPSVIHNLLDVVNKVAANEDGVFEAASSTPHPISLKQAHDRFHINKVEMRVLEKQSEGFIVDISCKQGDIQCESCLLCKMIRNNENKVAQVASARGDLYHSDSFQIDDMDGYNTCWVFVEHVTGFIRVYFTKGETGTELIQSLNMLWRDTGGFKRLHSDCGSAYISKEVDMYTAQRGIIQSFSPPYYKDENGKADRCIRSLKSMLRTVLHASRAPIYFWTFVLAHCVYVKNRINYKHGPSPYERFYEQKPNLAYIYPFGQLVYYLVESPKTHVDGSTTLYPKARKGIYLGHNIRFDQKVFTVGYFCDNGRGG